MRPLSPALLCRRRGCAREHRRRRAGPAHHHGLERAVEVVDRRRHHGRPLAQPPHDGAARRRGRLCAAGLDGQIELEALRLRGLPQAAPVLLCGTPTLSVRLREFPARIPSPSQRAAVEPLRRLRHRHRRGHRRRVGRPDHPRFVGARTIRAHSAEKSSGPGGSSLADTGLRLARARRTGPGRPIPPRSCRRGLWRRNRPVPCA